jgi:hypothetical protein
MTILLCHKGNLEVHSTCSLSILQLLAGSILLIAFLAIEAISRQPLMPLRIFRSHTRSGAYALSLVNGATLSGLLFLLTLFLQGVLGFSPLQAGFAFLPTAAGVVVSAAITSRLIGRIGPRLPMAIGALLAAIGLFWLSQITEHADYVSSLLGPLLAFSVGAGTIFVSTSVVAISGVKPDESGLASALLNVGRQLGGSLGIAIMGTIATTVSTKQLASAPFTPAAVNPALTTGYSAAFVAAGVIALAGFVIAVVAVRDSRQEVAVTVAAERERMSVKSATTVSTTVLQWLVRLTGALQIVLGALIWIGASDVPIRFGALAQWVGAADVLIQVHIASGVLFVLALVTLAIVAATAGVKSRFVALAIGWAVVVLILGLTQAQILPSSYHWIIQVLHVVIGLGAIGQSERLARRIKRGRKPAVARELAGNMLD